LKQLQFEWDVTKAAENLRKHRVSFEEARTVWNDRYRIVEVDAVHSTSSETRLQVLGLCDKLRLLLVIFTARNETIRIISARRATKDERRRYFQRFQGPAGEV
jgi:uncharacterized DUF497 family protein